MSKLLDNKGITAGILISLAIVAIFAVGPGVALAAETSSDKIAVISDVGGRGDLAFNDMAFMGGEKAEDDFGVEMIELISKTEADYLPNLRTAADDPDTVLIVGVGYLLTDALKTVAEEYPDKNFMGIDLLHENMPNNVIQVLYEEHKGCALVGALGTLLAAYYEKPHIGGVFGIEIPILWKFEIGYKWGANWAVNWILHNKPEMFRGIAKKPLGERVLWTYTGTFSDITKGYEAAKSMYDEDAVAVFNIAGPLGLGINQAVDEIATAEGLDSGPPFWIGVDANQDWINPDFIISSMIKRVDMGVYYTTQLVIENKFREDGIVGYPDNSRIMTLGIGTEVTGIPMEGIAISTLADLDEFIQMGLAAENRTGESVLPMSPDEIRAAAKALRDAQPDWIWEAVGELENQIRTGEVTVPSVMTADAIELWRGVFAKPPAKAVGISTTMAVSIMVVIAIVAAALGVRVGRKR